MRYHRWFLALSGIWIYWILFRYTPIAGPVLIPWVITPFQDTRLGEWAGSSVWPGLIFLFAGAILLYQQRARLAPLWFDGEICRASTTTEVKPTEVQSPTVRPWFRTENILLAIFSITILLRLVAADAFPPGFPQHTVAIFDGDYRRFLSEIEKLISGESPFRALRGLGYQVLARHLGLTSLIESIFYTMVHPNTIIAHFLPTLLGILSVFLMTWTVDESLGRRHAILVGAAFAASPWHLTFSRYPDLCLINCIAHYSLVLFCLVRLLKQPTPRMAVVFGFSLALGMYIYAPSQIVCFLMPVVVLGLLKHTLALKIRAIAVGVFGAVSAPMVLWHWSTGRLIPIQTPVNTHVDYKLRVLADWDRVKMFWDNIQFNARDPWYLSDFGVFAPLDRLLFPIALGFGLWICCKALKQIWAKKPLTVADALLVTVALNMFLGFLPTFLTPASTIRRMMISFGSVLILNAVLVIRGLALLKKPWQKCFFAAVVMIQVVTGPLLFINRVHSFEVENNNHFKVAAMFFADEKTRSMICYPDVAASHLRNMALFLNYLLYTRSDEKIATRRAQDLSADSTRFLLGSETKCIDWLANMPTGIGRIYLIDLEKVPAPETLINLLQGRFGAPTESRANPFLKIRKLLRWDLNERAPSTVGL